MNPNKNLFANSGFHEESKLMFETGQPGLNINSIQITNQYNNQQNNNYFNIDANDQETGRANGIGKKKKKGLRFGKKKQYGNNAEELQADSTQQTFKPYQLPND